MPDHPEIYRTQAGQYEELVSREDWQQNILPAIQNLVNLEGKTIVELGAGTGRLTRQLAPFAREILAFDISPQMLAAAETILTNLGYHNCRLSVGDHRKIDAPNHSVDLVVSGWSICYVVVDHPEIWEAELDNVFSEVKRVLKPDGLVILIETLGTGFDTPHPPDHLIRYYEHLEELGFKRTWIRTDYHFEDLDTAKELTSFFFGKDMISRIQVDQDRITLPECTGIWTKQI